MSRANEIEFSVTAQQFSPCVSFAESTSQPGSSAALDFLRNTIASSTVAAATATTVGQAGLGQAALLTTGLPPPTADWLDWMKNLQASGKLSFPFAASAAVTSKPPEALLSIVQQCTYLKQAAAYFPPGLMIPPTMTMDTNSETNEDDFTMNSLVKNSLLNMHLLAGQLPFWSLPHTSPRPPPTTPQQQQQQLAAVSRTLRCAETMSTAAATAECITDDIPTTHEEVGFLSKSQPAKRLFGAGDEKTARLLNSGEVTIQSALAGRCKSTDLSIRGLDQERSQLLNSLEVNSTQLQRGMEECRRYKQSALPKNPEPSVLKLYQDLRFSVRSCQNVRRKNTTRETTGLLKAWLNDHRKNPYPNKSEKIILAVITKMTLTQVSTWFANARRRLKKENKALSSCLPTEEADMEESLPTDCDKYSPFPQLSAECQSFSQTGSASSPPGLLVEDRLMSGEEEYDKAEVTEQQEAMPAESEEDRRPATTETHQHWTPRTTNKIWSLVDLAVPQCESDDSTRT